MINLLDPQAIVLGGGLSKLDAPVRRRARALGSLRVLGYRAPARCPPMHGDSSGVRGAAWLGRKRASGGAGASTGTPDQLQLLQRGIQPEVAVVEHDLAQHAILAEQELASNSGVSPASSRS